MFFQRSPTFQKEPFHEGLKNMLLIRWEIYNKLNKQKPWIAQICFHVQFPSTMALWQFPAWSQTHVFSLMSLFTKFKFGWLVRGYPLCPGNRLKKQQIKKMFKHRLQQIKKMFPRPGTSNSIET